LLGGGTLPSDPAAVFDMSPMVKDRGSVPDAEAHLNRLTLRDVAICGIPACRATLPGNF